MDTVKGGEVMADAKKVVKVRAIGLKQASLPHSDTGDTETTINVVKFNAEGVAEVPLAVAEALMEHYPQSVIMVG
jgi:hypothetical protein